MSTKSYKTRILTAGLAFAIAGLASGSAFAGPNDSASAYNPETNTTTTLTRGPNGGWVRTVEQGNTLDRHNPPPRPTSKPITGSMYDPATNTTTTLSTGPNGWARGVEQGNTLNMHPNPPAVRPMGGNASASLYNPETNTTTTVERRGGMVGRMVEIGNTLSQH